MGEAFTEDRSHFHVCRRRADDLCVRRLAHRHIPIMLWKRLRVEAWRSVDAFLMHTLMITLYVVGAGLLVLWMDLANAVSVTARISIGSVASEMASMRITGQAHGQSGHTHQDLRMATLR